MSCWKIAFDADGSGTISTAEMASVLKRCGMQKTPKELATLMKEADPDGSGSVDFDESSFSCSQSRCARVVVEGSPQP